MTGSSVFSRTGCITVIVISITAEAMVLKINIYVTLMYVTNMLMISEPIGMAAVAEALKTADACAINLLSTHFIN